MLFLALIWRQGIVNQQFLFDKSKSQNTNPTPIVISPDVRLISKDNRKVLIVANRPIFTYDISDKESERYLIAQLSRNNLATQEELSRCFDISIKTVKNHKSRFLHYGFQGLLSINMTIRFTHHATDCITRYYMMISENV